jgi:hypothetical protein
MTFDKNFVLIMSKRSDLNSLESSLVEKGFSVVKCPEWKSLGSYLSVKYKVVIIDEKYENYDWYDFVDVIQTEKVMVYSTNSDKLKLIFSGNPKEFKKPEPESLTTLLNKIRNGDSPGIVSND